VSEINVAQSPVSEGCETVSGMGHLLGYARVSTTDQQPQLQVDALQRAGCYRVFVETASGARADRPILEQVLDQLRPGDTLVVWKLDRLGRSLRHLVDTVTGLAEGGIGFRSLQEAIDTTTPGGKLVFHVFAALAEFERDLIRERTSAGLAAARARGRHGGRPSVLTGHKLQWPWKCMRPGSTASAPSPRPLGSAGPRSTATSAA
jgi:DNA invertase Pin-like site-specific DNA recombinase